MKTEVLTPLKASITGIDGAGKSTATDLVAGAIGTECNVVRVSRPTYSIVEGEKRDHYQAMLGLLDKLHELADVTQMRGAIMATNALNVIMQGRMIEPHMIYANNPELVLGSRDYIVDPSVYAMFYSPTLAKMSMTDRIDHMQDITGLEFRDVIFFLTVPPEIAIQRIEQRIESESKKRSKYGRKKWRHIHETQQNLGMLQVEYYNAFDVIAKKSSTKIYEIDTTRMDQVEVYEKIANTLSAFLKNKSTG